MTTLSVQVRNARIVRQGLQNLKAAVPRVGAERIYATLTRARDKLKQPGKRITYPVNWDSERQLIYVIAMLRKAGNLPYRRTGGYQRGWHIRRNPSSQRVMAGYSLINDGDAAQYIGGTAYGYGQSNIHRGRWPLVRDTVEKEVARLPQEIEQHISMVARREGL